MKKITPYLTERNALKALDNGGRFYNIFTKSNDKVVTTSELYRAAGITSGKIRASLFFEMSLRNLESSAKLKKSAIIEGYPVFLKDKQQLTTFIMVPIATGNTTSFMMLPIVDVYDVYEVFSGKSKKGDNVLIAVLKGKQKLPFQSTIFGGTVTKTAKKEKGKMRSKYLEAVYYCD